LGSPYPTAGIRIQARSWNDLAQRAGLGWVGKNTCLIHPSQGSYFLLAEILLGIDLEPDVPFVTDHCGSCTRCIEACPTDCILPDRTLDAARCISYLTIELKGAIPQELRPQIGDWIFGCDLPAGLPVEPALRRARKRPGVRSSPSGTPP
jgi:epoxyqueuosine reductase